MARQHKQGLDYFPHDCHFDDQLEYIIALHKEPGYYIYFRILEKIYSGYGYYIDANEKKLILLSNQINVDILALNDVINSCLCEHLFNEKLYKSYKILTSRGIQERFFEAIKRRKNIELINEYILLKDVNIILQNVNIIELNVSKSTQSKVKKSKEEKRIVVDEKSTYKNMIELWFSFYEHTTGNKPSFTGASGKAIKSIIKKSENLNQNPSALFEAILNKWQYLDSWQQENCLDINVFNSKFDLIINRLKDNTDEQFNHLYEKYGKPNN